MSLSQTSLLRWIFMMMSIMYSFEVVLLLIQVTLSYRVRMQKRFEYIGLSSLISSAEWARLLLLFALEN